jgi:hypothetical protein
MGRGRVDRLRLPGLSRDTLMKKTILFIVLALLVQASWFLYPSLLYTKTMAFPYRYDERQKALADFVREKSPETRLVFDQERPLLNKHLQCRAGLSSILFLVVDGVGIYYLWNYLRRRTVA